MDESSWLGEIPRPIYSGTGASLMMPILLFLECNDGNKWEYLQTPTKDKKGARHVSGLDRRRTARVSAGRSAINRWERGAHKRLARGWWGRRLVFQNEAIRAMRGK
jgi:hypothetical protein